MEITEKAPIFYEGVQGEAGSDCYPCSTTSYATGVTVINVERKSGSDAPSNSYHVEVHCLDVRTILTPGFWPVGVGSRKYFKKRIVNSRTQDSD